MSVRKKRVQGSTQKHVIDVNNQSVILDGRPECRGSWLSMGPRYKDRKEGLTRDIHNIYDVLEAGRRASDNGPCLGTRSGQNRQYDWMSYQEVIAMCQQLGSGLIHLGLEPKNDTLVGILSKNRYEWVVTSYGLSFYSMVSVPIYDTLGPEARTHIIRQGEINLVVTETELYADRLIKGKADTPSLKTLVMMEGVGDRLRQQAEMQGVEIYSFSDVMEMGRQHLKDLMVSLGLPPLAIGIHAKPAHRNIERVVVLERWSFPEVVGLERWSFWRGLPKGVVLSVKKFICTCDVTMQVLEAGSVHLGPEDTHMSYLPLAHNDDRRSHILMLVNGAKVGYWRGDSRHLVDDLTVLKPTVFVSVPRFYRRLYDTAHNAVAGSWIKSTLLKCGLARKKKDVERGVFRRDSFWDKFILKKFQDKLGGRVRLLVSGSAPLSPEVANFLRCSFGCVVLEVYGQTEATAGLTTTLPFDVSVGHVGPPLPGIQIKLVDVPGMGFHVANNQGEICVKSDTILDSYFKDPAMTSEVLDEYGWLHTGDVGMWLPNGALKIIDRKKHIIKLSRGDYISPERIELVYTENPFVLQCYVNGDSTKDKAVAVVVPDSEFTRSWAPKNGFPTDIKELCQNQSFKDFVLKELQAHGTFRQLQDFEQVIAILLEPEPWSADNGLLTPTLNNKRSQLKNKYWDRMQTLYKSWNG